MSEDKNKKYLIVGQGLAGTTLAHIFAKNNLDFEIIDNDYKTSSSHAAYGLYNPIVIKRLLKSWKADIVLPAAYKFYSEIEKIVDQKLIFPEENFRKIATEEERANWNLKSTEEEYEKYLLEIVDQNSVSEVMDAPFGYGKIGHTGRVDLPAFLTLSKAFFAKKVRQEEFDYAQVEFDENSVRYKGENYARIVFCEGYMVFQNPFFQNIKMKPVKGESLILKIPNLNLDKTIKTKIFIIPEGNDLYKVGSTYNWAELNETPTEKGKDELLQKLKSIIDLPYEIIDQTAGVRPAAHDRRPIVGPSEMSPNILCFNGLGAKGVMLAPHFAKVLYDFITSDITIPKVVSTARYL